MGVPEPQQMPVLTHGMTDANVKDGIKDARASARVGRQELQA